MLWSNLMLGLTCSSHFIILWLAFWKKNWLFRTTKVRLLKSTVTGSAKVPQTTGRGSSAQIVTKILICTKDAYGYDNI